MKWWCNPNCIRITCCSAKNSIRIDLYCVLVYCQSDQDTSVTLQWCDPALTISSWSDQCQIRNQLLRVTFPLSSFRFSKHWNNLHFVPLLFYWIAVCLFVFLHMFTMQDTITVVVAPSSPGTQHRSSINMAGFACYADTLPTPYLHRLSKGYNLLQPDWDLGGVLIIMKNMCLFVYVEPEQSLPKPPRSVDHIIFTEWVIFSRSSVCSRTARGETSLTRP